MQEDFYIDELHSLTFSSYRSMSCLFEQPKQKYDTCDGESLRWMREFHHIFTESKKMISHRLATKEGFQATTSWQARRVDLDAFIFYYLVPGLPDRETKSQQWAGPRHLPRSTMVSAIERVFIQPRSLDRLINQLLPPQPNFETDVDSLLPLEICPSAFP